MAHLERLHHPTWLAGAAALVQVALLPAQTYTYSGNQNAMNQAQAPAGTYDTIDFNITGGYFGTSGARSQTYTNENIVVTQMTMNNGWGEAVTTFSDATTFSGSGDITLTTAGLGQDFIFAGNMQSYLGDISIADFGSLNLTLGNTGSQIVQFGGTTAGGTVALGTVTPDAGNGYIDNVSGTGSVSGNNLVFNYAADAGYDYLKVNNAITVNDSVAFSGSADIEVNSVVTGTGALIQQGTGEVTLTSNNTYSGATNVQSGILRVGAGGTTGTVGSGAVTIASGAELIIDRSTTYNPFPKVTGDGVLRLRGGSGAVNQFTGNWLRLGNNESGGFHLDMGASLNDRGDIVFSDIWGDGGAGNQPKFTIASLSGYGYFRSDWGGGSGNRTISVDQDIDTEYHGRILQNNTSSRSIDLEKLGSGTLTLTGAHSYQDTFVGGGTLEVGNGGTTGNLGSGTVTVDSGAELRFNRSNEFSVANVFAGTGTITKAGGGRMNIQADNSGAVRTWNFSGSGNGDIGFTNASSVGATGSKITVQDGGTGSFFFYSSQTTDVTMEIGSGAELAWNGSTGASYTGTGVISGAGDFRKQSGSTLILAADNTYTGQTLVDTGTLIINGDQSAATGAITVASGATLGGSGTIGGSTLIQSGASLAPGTSVGTLGINNTLTVDSGGVLAFEIESLASFDRITDLTGFSMNGTLALQLNSYNPINGDTFDLVDWSAGTPTGSFLLDDSLAPLDPGLSWDTSSFLSTGTVSVIPEPRISLLGLIGVLGILRRRRR